MANIVVTGANRGIGLEFCRQFAKRGDRVIGLCRKSSPELKELGVKIIENINVGHRESLKDLHSLIHNELQDSNLDILINNAGILYNETIDEFNTDTIEEQFQVNCLGPLVVAKSLLSLMGKGSKILAVTSRMGSLEDNTSGGYYGYRMSKAALNMGYLSLSIDLKMEEIIVGLLHPGFVQSRMVNFQGDISPEKSVKGMLKVIDSLEIEQSGQFYHYSGSILPW